MNLAPTFVFVLFWVGIPVVSVLFGDVVRAFTPWRALGRGARYSLSVATLPSWSRIRKSATSRRGGRQAGANGHDLGL